MQKELEGWRKENADHADALRREERCALEKELYNSFVCCVDIRMEYVCVCVCVLVYYCGAVQCICVLMYVSTCINECVTHTLHGSGIVPLCRLLPASLTRSFSP